MTGKMNFLNTVLLVRQWLNGNPVKIEDKIYEFPKGREEIQKMMKKFDLVS